MQRRLQLGFWLLCLLAVWLWPLIWLWQWVLQLLLSIALVWLAVKDTAATQAGQHFSLDDEGKADWLVAGQWRPYQLSSSSVSCDWFCYLVLEPLAVELYGKTKARVWVFRDSVDDNSYRRLCRVILRIRRS